MPVPAIFYGQCCESSVNPTHQVGRFYHMTFQNCHIAAIGEKIARCVLINRWRKSLAIFAGDQIRRDRRIKSPGVSLALHSFLPLLIGSYVKWFSDSQSAYKIIQVGSMRSDLHGIALEIF